MSHNWSAMLSFTKTWSAAQNSTFFGTGFRQDVLVVTPVDLINTESNGQINHRLLAEVERHLERTVRSEGVADASLPGRPELRSHVLRRHELRHGSRAGRTAVDPSSARHSVTDIRIEKQVSLDAD